MGALGFDVKNEQVLSSVSDEIIKSSEIEGAMLNLEQVCSSVARRLNIDYKSFAKPSRYIDGAGWFMTAAQSLATFYVLPAVIALLGSYMICREEQEDTLKSLRLIPVDEVKLTLAKMILAFVFSVLIYLLLFAITFLVEAVLHLEVLSVGLVLENLKIYFLDGVGVFFAISPIIALVARMKKGYWLALVFAEIYSFAGLFASMSQQLKTVYPMTTVFNISGYYNANMFQVLIGVVILMVCVILSLLILKGLNRKTK